MKVFRTVTSVLFCLVMIVGCNPSDLNPLQLQGNPSPVVTHDLAVWSASFGFNGFTFPFTMVGTNPTVAGAGTTNIKVVIIPLVLDFNGVSLSPLGPACGDNTSILTRVQNSPLFTSVPWSFGGTAIGTTQFGDAFQRANFWSSVSTISPNYHVLLNPVSPQAVQPIEVPPLAGFVTFNSPCLGQPIGNVSQSFLDPIIQGLISNLGITADVLPIFLTYNINVAPTGAELGYHSRTSDNHSYIVGSYTDTGLLGFNVADISVLSHEVGEWMNNPLLINEVPAWGHLVVFPGCQTHLEVGDGTIQTIASVVASGFTYHVQDLTFFSWFARESPSRAVNGWYSTMNTLSGPPPVCL